ncbi:hypothetical protein RSA36_21865 [Pantoea stewartii]|uniref:Uncharacterized protein n=1 Tax=Pantoea stewartii TaxID=66269 RepID=A0AB34VEE5_9GAMM|nr:hypothetical protein RSA30_21545 [Pantoea stewartii]KTS97623.1 hypothetical protein RSA13_11015 [Pantoea stewartii]KTT04939.1 hypothetical protein RSA36_21865 [Pantoea stewartii]
MIIVSWLIIKGFTFFIGTSLDKNIVMTRASMPVVKFVLNIYTCMLYFFGVLIHSISEDDALQFRKVASIGEQRLLSSPVNLYC